MKIHFFSQKLKHTKLDDFENDFFIDFYADF